MFVAGLDFTDDHEPVLKGKVGARACGVRAWVDDVVVLPADESP